MLLNDIYRILEQSSDYCCIAEPTGKLIWGNSRFYELCGIANPGDTKLGLAALLQLSNEAAFTHELVAAATLHTDRTIVSYCAIFDAHISIVITDIDSYAAVTIAGKYGIADFETKQYNNSILIAAQSKQKEELLQVLMEQVPISLLLLDKRLQVLWASDAWFARYHLTREEALGKTLAYLFPEMPSHLSTILQTCLLSGHSYGSEKEEMQLFDGSEQIVRWSINPWYADNVNLSGLMVIADIITENVKKEQQYKRLLREFELLCVLEDTVIAATDEFTMLDNVCKKIIECGQFELAWIGYAPDPANESQLIYATHKFGTAIHYLDDFYIDLNNPEHRKGPSATALKTGKSQVVNNMQSSAIFGPWLQFAERFNLHSSISLPMQLKKGQSLVLAIYSDENDSFTNNEVIILERIARTVNFALDNIQRKYENKVAEIQQHKLIADLNLRNRSLEEFSHVVSHNLRAKVADLMGISNLLTDNENALPAKELNELIREIGRTVTKLDEVMRDLNSTLLVKTNVLLIQEKVDLSRLLSEIIQKLLFEYPTKKINFTTDFSRINYFWSCRYYLFEVILQLMHSMIKYNTFNNEVTIAIASAIVDKNVIISVTDEITGLNIGGISNNILDVYKKLYQHLTGGGIKLFYAQAIAETLGGQLTVENDRKSKITFSITMPLGYDYLAN